MADSTLKAKTARGLLWGLVNNGSMQMLNLVFGIVLANLLSRSDYGLASEVTLFTTLAAALQEGGFIAALINRKNATRQDFNAVFWFNLGSSLLLYALLFATAPLIARFFGEPELTSLTRFASLSFVLASLSVAPRAMLYKALRVREQTIVTLCSLALSGAVGIAMALLGARYWSLATQGLCFVGTTAALSWVYSGFRPMWAFNWQPIRQMFAFSCKLLITNVFNTLNNSVFTLAFGRFYTKMEVGTYTQADKWNKMGSALITGMVQGVAQPMFVSVGDDRERLLRAFRKMLRFTALIAFPAMLGLALCAAPLIVVTVGRKWLPSAELMQLLCVAGAFMPITALYHNFLISRGRSDVYMWNILAQGLLTLAMLCAIKQFGWQLTLHLPWPGAVHLSGIRLMVACYVALYIAWLLAWHTFLRRELPLPLLTACKDTLPFALAAAAAMLVAWGCTRPLHDPWLLLLARIPIAGGLYLAIIWLSGAHILREAIDYLRHRQ